MSDPGRPGGAHEPTAGRTEASDGVHIVDRVHVRQLRHQGHVYTRVAQGTSVTAPVSERDVGIVRRMSAMAASAIPNNHHPPSCARPNTASAFTSSWAHSVSSSPVTWGVSDAISSIGRALSVAAVSTVALASRSAKSAPRCSTTVKADSRDRISAVQLAGRGRPSAPPPLPAPASRRRRRACPAVSRLRCRRPPVRRPLRPAASSPSRAPAPS